MDGALHSLLSSPTSASSKSKPARRGRRRNSEYYPVFSKWSEQSEDVYWKNFFADAARGQFPPKLYIANNQLVCGISKRRAISLKGSSMEDVMNFVKSTGITYHRPSSPTSQALRAQNNIVWDKLKLQKPVVHRKLYNWATGQREKYQLNAYEFDRLTALLNYALISNQINDQTVQLERGKIINITNIIFVPESRIFYLEPPPKYRYTQSSNKVKKENKNKFVYKWAKTNA